MEICCNAKLNLSLDITGRRNDGYHYVDTVMQSVDLFDTLYIDSAEEDGIELRSNLPFLPVDERNLVCRAAHLLAEAGGVTRRGVKAYIEKRIPVGAGLAGGSANAAGTLLALRELWGLDIDDAELSALGLKLGADVPFCLSGGTARATGTGELLTPLKPFPRCFFVIAMPDTGVLTKEAFQLLDAKHGYERPDTEALVAAIGAGDARAAAKRFVNVFETSGTCGAGDLTRKMLSLGAKGAALTGSGSAVFGLFESHLEAEACRLELIKEYRAWTARPVERGIYVKPRII